MRQRKHRFWSLGVKLSRHQDRPILRLQTLDQGVDLLFEMRQGLVGVGTIEVVDLPILDPVFPERELLGHQGAVFCFLDGDDEIGLG